jgi:DNA topoisomerase I
LPALQVNQPLRLKKSASEPKQTQPPPRYTEPKLVQLMERKGIGRPSTYAPTIKTLKDRAYVEIEKSKLQPTALGLDLDGALEKLLPDLIQPEFTAQMEADLDAIAQGKTEWQQYLTGWNDAYFAPALALAMQQLTPARSVSTKPPSSSPKSAQSCPKCQGTMHKISSKSKKLAADHFLKCGDEQCGTVMFWNSKIKQYELPYGQRSPDPESLTEKICPVCGAFLERYRYQKDGTDKVMLRCAIPEHRQGKCKEVAFFESRGEFWSPKFGVL